MEQVPKAGERVIMHHSANLSLGGTLILPSVTLAGLGCPRPDAWFPRFAQLCLLALADLL
jgi:hypothetical protein